MDFPSASLLIEYVTWHWAQTRLPHLLPRDLPLLLADRLERLLQRPSAESQLLRLRVVTVDADETHLPMLLGDLGVDLFVRLPEVVDPELLLELRRVGRLAGEADAARLPPRGIDGELVLQHVDVTVRLVVLDPHPPAVPKDELERPGADPVLVVVPVLAVPLGALLVLEVGVVVVRVLLPQTAGSFSPSGMTIEALTVTGSLEQPPANSIPPTRATIPETKAQHLMSPPQTRVRGRNFKLQIGNCKLEICGACISL